MRDLVDHSSPCIPCAGSGVQREARPDLGPGKYVAFACYYCRGSGKRTVLVGDRT